MDLGIAGRVALVTAASKGLGRASARALAQEGVSVAICARGETALREAEAEIGAYGEVLAVVADVTEPSAPARLVEETLERFGGSTSWWPTPGGRPRAGRWTSTTNGCRRR